MVKEVTAKQGQTDWDWVSCGRRGCNSMGVCACKGGGKKARWLAHVSWSLEDWSDKIVQDGNADIDGTSDAPGPVIQKSVRFNSHMDTSMPERRIGLLANGYSDGTLSLLTAKPSNALSAVGAPEWQEIKITVDSGACDTVMPTSLSPRISLLQNALSQSGMEYEVANGQGLPNMGEKRCIKVP